MKQITKYVAFDGAEFDSEHAARDHETKNAWKRLTPLHEDICRVLKIYDLPVEDRPEADVELATVLETVGVWLQRARIAKREVKRERKAKAELSAPPSAAPPASTPESGMNESYRPDDSAPHPPCDMVAEHTAEMEERRQARVAEGLPGALHGDAPARFVEDYSEKEPA